MIDKKKLKEKYKDEEVFVIPVNLVQNLNDKFTKQKHNPNIWNKYDSLGKYIPRWEAEYNSAFQQIIPYFLVTNIDQTKYYVAKRIKGETRLINKLSLGFGGHINPCDTNHECVLKALCREMNEELNIQDYTNAQFIGTMRDIKSSTNDHFGLVFILKVKEENVSIKETDNLEGTWMTKEELFSNYNLFEGWAKYLIDYMKTNNI